MTRGVDRISPRCFDRAEASNNSIAASAARRAAERLLRDSAILEWWPHKQVTLPQQEAPVGYREEDCTFGPDIQVGPDGRPVSRGWMWAVSRSTPPEHRFVRVSYWGARRILGAIGDTRKPDPRLWLDALNREAMLEKDVLAWLQAEPDPTLLALLEAAACVAAMCATWWG